MSPEDSVKKFLKIAEKNPLIKTELANGQVSRAVQMAIASKPKITLDIDQADINILEQIKSDTTDGLLKAYKGFKRQGQ